MEKVGSKNIQIRSFEEEKKISENNDYNFNFNKNWERNKTLEINEMKELFMSGDFHSNKYHRKKLEMQHRNVFSDNRNAIENKTADDINCEKTETSEQAIESISFFSLYTLSISQMLFTSRPISH